MTQPAPVRVSREQCGPKGIHAPLHARHRLQGARAGATWTSIARRAGKRWAASLWGITQPKRHGIRAVCSKSGAVLESVILRGQSEKKHRMTPLVCVTLKQEQAHRLKRKADLGGRGKAGQGTPEGLGRTCTHRHAYTG